ncbi:MAG: hypothetical protein HC889_15265, partial [Synechococcaceae cyanobacterium SM1_2_3]|nr:hypothetical protein [Synechococcaceae cyanobacterium SM1_2_3]
SCPLVERESGSQRGWTAVGVGDAGALVCSVELALDGVLPLAKVVPAMLSVHALIGVGEALITVAALALLDRPVTVSASPAAHRFAAPTLAALLIALCLSPLASSFPDGLEAVLAQFQVLHEAAPLFVTPLADYQVAGVDSGMLSTGLAGLLGVALTFGIAAALALPLTRPRLA